MVKPVVGTVDSQHVDGGVMEEDRKSMWRQMTICFALLTTESLIFGKNQLKYPIYEQKQTQAGLGWHGSVHFAAIAAGWGDVQSEIGGASVAERDAVLAPLEKAGR
jgi:hypothetical protein